MAPHVALVSFTGFRIREEEMLELGMTLPGLKGRAEAIGRLPSLGLLTLAGMTPPAWTCSYHEQGVETDSLLERVLAENPTLVAISALTASINDAYLFCGRIKQAGVFVVLGGLHATTRPQEASRHCDAVVIGEGEPVWHQLLADARSGELKQSYRARLAFDLANAPIPRFDLLGSKRRSRLTLQTQRGCPLACEFCGASRLLGPFREKPVAGIERELSEVARLSGRHIVELADDNTFAGNRDLDSFFETLAASGVRYFTEVDWRVGVRPEVVERLAGSGCVQVLVGVESLAHSYRGMGAKRAEPSVIMDALSAIQQTGVAVNGCFVVGSDGETRKSIEELGRFILESDLADVQLTLQTPFPGTALYHRLDASGRLLPDRDWSYYTLFDVTYQPQAMCPDELQRAFVALVRRVFDEEASQRRSSIRRAVWRRHPRLGSCESELCFDS